MKKKGVALSLLSISLIGACVYLTPSTNVQMPPEVTGVPRSVPPESPSSWSRTRVPTPQVPSPTLKPGKTRINVVTKGIGSYWQFDVAMTNWNKQLKWTQLTKVKACPVAEPCVVVKYSKLPNDTAAVTSFGYRNDVTIELNPVVKNPKEALATGTHELGHVLGVPHITGTSNTVMNPILVQRTTPSGIDVGYANRDKTWTVEEAYKSSSKDVDVRAVPR